jgi:hypothetical protein
VPLLTAADYDSHDRNLSRHEIITSDTLRQIKSGLGNFWMTRDISECGFGYIFLTHDSSKLTTLDQMYRELLPSNMAIKYRYLQDHCTYRQRRHGIVVVARCSSFKTLTRSWGHLAGPDRHLQNVGLSMWVTGSVTSSLLFIHPPSFHPVERGNGN